MARVAKKMRAAVLMRPGELRLESRDVPKPGANEVLVQIKAVGVCGSDVHFYRRGRIGDSVVTKPLILGHEAAGKIVSLGRGVQKLKVGQAVSIEPGWPCGRCEYCKTGRYNQCLHIQFLGTPPDDGAFRDYVVVPADFAHPMAEGMSFAEGAMVEPLAVGVHACRKGEVHPGDTVLVSGCGPIGLCCMMAAFGMGASRVFLSEPDSYRREAALEMGATAVFDPARREGADCIKEVMGHDAQVVLEASGSECAIQQAIEMIGPGGRIVLVGFPHQDMVPVNLTHLMFHEAEIRTVWRYANDFPLAIHLVSSGKAPVSKLITHRHPLEKIAEAMAKMGEPRSLKAVIEF